MFRLTPKLMIIYGLCLFIIFQHIFIKYYSKNEEHPNEKMLFVRSHIRKGRIDVENGPIIEPLKQDEEKNIENNQLINIIENKKTPEKLQTSSTTVTPEPSSTRWTILKAFPPAAPSINNMKHVNLSILKPLPAKY